MKNEKENQWFVMRDLKRYNAKLPAYKQLANIGIKVFVPMKLEIEIHKNIIERKETPIIKDLLFVYDSRLHLDPIVEKIPTLQYRWLRNTFRMPMTVSDTEMERFIQAVNSSDSPKYYLPEEITPQMYKRRIRIIGGPLNGLDGFLLTVRGSKVKRLLVSLDGLVAVSVEVIPEYIQVI